MNSGLFNPDLKQTNMLLEKKILLILLFVICSPVRDFAQYRYVLKGTLPKGYDKKHIYLRIMDYYSDHNFKTTDSALIDGNSFVLAGQIDREAETALLGLDYKNGYFGQGFTLSFILDSGTNVVQINDLGIGNYYPNKLANIKFPFSKTNALYMKEDSLINFYNQYLVRDTAGGTVSFNLPKDRSDQMNADMLKLIKVDSTNYYSLIYLRTALRMGRDQQKLREAFNHLDPVLKAKKLGLELSTALDERIEAAKRVTLGKGVPMFSVRTFEGRTFKNAELAGQNYLLVFSATWCGPCQRQLPMLSRLYQKYKDRGLKVVYFNLDDNVKIWADHIKKNRLSWINVSERTRSRDSKIAALFNVTAIPNCLLVNKEGKIVYNSDQMDPYLNELEAYIVKHL